MEFISSSQEMKPKDIKRKGLIMGFDDIDEKTLWDLRMEISLGSLYYSDYENTFGFTTHSVCDFFDSYFDYLDELAEEKFGINYTFEEALTFDNMDNLWNWWGCYETFPFDVE